MDSTETNTFKILCRIPYAEMLKIWQNQTAIRFYHPESREFFKTYGWRKKDFTRRYFR